MKRITLTILMVFAIALTACGSTTPEAEPTMPAEALTLVAHATVISMNSNEGIDDDEVEQVLYAYKPPSGYKFIGTLYPGNSCFTGVRTVTSTISVHPTMNPGVATDNFYHQEEVFDGIIFVKYSDRTEVFAPVGKTCRGITPAVTATPMFTPTPIPTTTPEPNCVGVDPKITLYVWDGMFSLARAPRQYGQYIWVNPNGLGSQTDHGCVLNGTPVTFVDSRHFRIGSDLYQTDQGAPYMNDDLRLPTECTNGVLIGQSYAFWLSGDGDSNIPYYTQDGQEIWSFSPATQLTVTGVTADGRFIVDVNGSPVYLDQSATCLQ